MDKMMLSTEQKGKLIGSICFELKNKSDQIVASGNNNHVPFDYGDTFFSLAFKTDKEILKIAKLCGVN
jgi:hypothetical protein